MLFTKKNQVAESIIVDARMKGGSGIGRYIKEVNSRLKYREFKPNREPFNLLDLLFLRFPRARMIWFPHWNIPLFGFFPKKTIVTIYDLYHLDRKSDISFYKYMIARIFISRAIRRSSLVLTISEFTKRRIVHYFPESKNKVKVIYCGVKTCIPAPLPDVKYNYILFVGNVKPHKNLTRAYLAFLKIKQIYPDLHFVIVGKSTNFYSGDIDFLDMTKNATDVHFTGAISDEELFGYYKEAELLLFPSLYEGFGLPPLEAQSVGTACVVSKIASLPEIYGDTVMYCDPNSVDSIAKSIESVLLDETIKFDLIEKGFKNIERFSWERTASEIGNFIRNLDEDSDCS